MAQQNHYELGLDLLSEDNYCRISVPLRRAAIEGNWKAAYEIIEENSLNRSDILRKAITRGHATILHVAVGARQRTFVKKLIIKFTGKNDDRLLVRDGNGNNAFCFAAAAGEVEIARLMHTRNPELCLPTVRGAKVRGNQMAPLDLAVMFGRNDMATYLYDLTKPTMTFNDQLKDLFFSSITTDLYGFALTLLTDHPRLATTRDVFKNESGDSQSQAPEVTRNESGDSQQQARDVIRNESRDSQPQAPETALHMLARMHVTSDALKLVEKLWETIKIERYESIVNLITRPRNLLFDAAEAGNSKFLEVVVRSYPDLIHILNENKLSIFHIAISHRHTNVFKLIYEMGFDKELLASYVGAKDGNNMLHLAAKYPDSRPTSMVPGAALEFQQELLTFEEVEKIIEPSLRDQKNKIKQRVGHSPLTEASSSRASTEESITIEGGNTPKELFTKTHKDLKERGEKWMKSTATSCMLVATLIATVVFAAAFSVPGGNDQLTGRPIHLHKKFFKVFVASDAIALLFSSLSILFFLSILTSRYEEKDFRMRLPLKLIFGLLTLFISVIAMNFAFSSAFFLFYGESSNGITALTIAIIFAAAIVYLVLHYSLLKDTICSTFCRRNQIKTKRLPV